MPIAYEVDELLNRVFMTATGDVDDTELLKTESAFLGDVRVKRGFRALFDATSASRVRITAQALDDLVQLETRHADKMLNSKLALVVHDSAGWNIAKYFEARAKRSVVVFFNMDIARAWLGLE